MDQPQEIIRIVQHNVLNWRERRYQLTDVYKSLDADVILINSHGVPNDTPLKIHGYNVYKRNFSNTPSDGTAIAVKHSVSHRLLDDFISDTLAIELDTNTGKILLATLYQPPTRNYLPIPDFFTLFRRQTPVYMLTDLNANHPNLGYTHTNTKGRQIHHLISNRTLQHIGPHFPTYIAHNAATTPDIILTNNRAYHNMHIEQGPLTTSDHIPIVMTLATKPIQIPIPKRPDFKRADWTKFKTDITDKVGDPSIPENPTLEDIDEKIEDWYRAVQDSMTNNIPSTSYKTIFTSTFSHTSRTLIAQFNAMRLHAQRNGWDHELYRQYRRLQYRLHDSLLNDSKANWTNIVTDTVAHHSDPATFWRKIKNLMGTADNTPQYLLSPDNTKIFSDHDKELLHRQHWQEIYSDEDDPDIDEETERTVRLFLTTNLQRTFPYDYADMTRLDAENSPLTFPITNDEINAIIKHLKKTCPGQSGINKTILQNLPQVSIIRLTNIFNASLAAGYFPDSFKEAIIKLIPKPGKSPRFTSNFRPISLLEVPGKIFERIINKRLRSHLELNELLNPLQFGFRTGRGTTHALALATESIAQQKADKGHCHVALRDITKAFDKVWHAGLKYKILHLGLPTSMEKLLCDFLEDRKARIRLGTALGDSFSLECGVPQGSVLSPTLFTIYTNDAPPPVRGINVAYADDVTQIVGYPGRSKAMAQRALVTALESQNEFENKWKIKTNINKFKIIRLGSRDQDEIITNDTVHETTGRGTILGLTITKTGYYEHVKNRRNIALQSLIKLYRFKDMPTKIKTQLVKTLVLPILDYPPIPTHTLSKTQISKLQKIQNRALRFATGQRYPYTLNTREIHHITKTIPVNQRLHLQAEKIWMRLQQLGLPTYTTLMENKDNLSYNRHFPSSLKIINEFPEPAYY